MFESTLVFLSVKWEFRKIQVAFSIFHANNKNKFLIKQNASETK